MNKRRVVVTGLGVISPLGTGITEFWSGLKEGRSGIVRITHFDSTLFDCQIAGMVPNYNPLDHFNSKEARTIADFVQFACIASKEALAAAQFDPQKVDLDRVGVLVGSGIGSILTFEEEHRKFMEKGPSRISPHFIPKMIINEAAGHVSIQCGARGINTCVATACSTATNAIGDALRFIQYGDADMMIAGGTESANTELGMGGFCALKALSTKRNNDPQKASRPFDMDRDGFVMGEGAGIAILEELSHAKKRGAPILCELVGYGRTGDAYHITAPHPEGIGGAKAMELAIHDAGLTPKDISYINAHGTSTKLNDKIETMAIKRVFGDLAKKVPISSTKSMTGHLLGAAGGVEFAASVLAVMNDIIPPTINYETPDPDCDLDYVPNVARRAKVNVAMSNSLGFGGHNATVVVKKFQE
ncbi:MAG: beta-ketoacyl-ACP synthase II [Candidatus Omnitrophica bacterium]|nr:beta-ketoacyl-ACP synthase II [Candidatus Omnitrophota bacterium]